MKRLFYAHKAFSMRVILFTLISFSFSLNVFAKTPERDLELNREYYKECVEASKYIVGGKYTVECFYNYHHFNSNSARNHYRHNQTINDGEVKIGTFNLWHPGSLRSAYKDYELVAKIIDQWDIVAATELIGVVGQDSQHNQRLVDFIDQAPIKIEELQKRLSRGDGDPLKLQKRITQLSRDLVEAPSLYRGPGYLILLEELRKLDPSWALIQTPRGDAARENNLHELTGFFYRGSKVRPQLNDHCDEFKGSKPGFYGEAFACYPELGEDFMGRDTNNVFARRPFVGSFQSGVFDYTLVASHVIFGSPSDEERMAEILEPSFGVSDYRVLGTGANLQTYARWAEMKITLELMSKLESEYDINNVIYLGDANLPSANQFWPNLLSGFPGIEVFIEDPTTLSVGRYYSDGTPTEGAGNDYDHFIFDPNRVTSCVSDNGEVEAGVFYYHKEPMTRDYIKNKYLIRDYRKSTSDNEPSTRDGMTRVNDYEMIPGAERKINRQLDQLERLLLRVRTVNNNMEIVWDDYRFDLKLQYFRDRVFLDQLVDRFFYRVYMETISDHYPIWMNCRTDR